DDVFQVQRPHTGPHTRQVNAARCISYRQQSYHFPQLHKGDIIEVNESKDQIDFAYLGNVVQSIRKPLRQHTATTRKVQTGGLVNFKQQRVVPLQRGGKYQRLAWRPSQEQKGIDERALKASLPPSPPS